MFCPKCATQNIDGASYCRGCGANISLVPQALTGQLMQPSSDERSRERDRGHRRREPTLDSAFKNMFTGIAFLIVSIGLSRSIGRGWWFWLLIPAFSMMATGIAQFVRLREREKGTALNAAPLQPPAFTDRGMPVAPGTLPQRSTGELIPPPPSVTEGTTRHLGVEAATKHLDQQNDHD
jgi:zinc-ribbon domain